MISEVIIGPGGVTFRTGPVIVESAASVTSIPRARVLGVSESSEVITLWKAPQAKRTGLANEVTQGFNPAQYPGEGAFFATDRTIAEDFLRSYGNGLQEINIPRSTFDRLVHEGVIEVDGLYAAGRSWHVRPGRMGEFNQAVMAGASNNHYHAP